MSVRPPDPETRLELRLAVYQGRPGEYLRALYRGPLPPAIERAGVTYVPVLHASLWDLRGRELAWPDLEGWRVGFVAAPGLVEGLARSALIGAAGRVVERPIENRGPPRTRPPRPRRAEEARRWAR